MSAPRLIEDVREVEALCRDAAAAGRVAIDTEADSFHSYHHKLCLVQVSFDGTHALLDPLRLGRAGLAPLAELLADPSIPTLMHGADYDVRVLDRDLAARIHGLLDTQLAAQFLGEPHTGLAALLEKELGVSLDKRFQRADWGARPLSPEMRAYAVADTAHLDRLEGILESRVEALGRRSWWLEECRVLEDVRYEAPTPDPLAFERIKGARKLHGGARDRLAALFAWREEVAATEDRPPFHVLSSEAMLALAEAAPTMVSGLAEVKGLPRPVVRRRGEAIVRVMAAASPAPPRVERPRFVVDRVREGRVRNARTARDARAEELAIEPGLLAPRATLEAVVDELPRTPEQLFTCLQRHWRTAVLADTLLPLVAAWCAGEGSGVGAGAP